MYRFLARERTRLFPAELLADLSQPTGRRSVPPSILAVVFNAATSSWVCQLSRACAKTRRSEVTARVVRTVTVNLLRVFSRGPAGQRHPSRSNLARSGLDSSDG